ncbi:MAG: single-stranded DNA-binding protein [Clostridia bacterium]|nr:single-stranded DNA-binding protein [Clostridia bacterium]
MRKIKIFNDDKLIYERNLAVNTAILRGRIHKNVEKFGSTYHFTLKLSNGMDEKTGQWRNPTYADCTAFGELGEQIYINYCSGDEIFIIGKFYANKTEDKVYKGFTIREVIGLKTVGTQETFTDNKGQQNKENTEFEDDDLPF